MSVEKHLFADLHPRTIDFGLTRLPTKGATISAFGTVIIWGLKFIVTSIVWPGRGLLLKMPVQRSDLAHDIAVADGKERHKQQRITVVALAEGRQRAPSHPIDVAWSNSQPQPQPPQPHHSDAVVALPGIIH